MKSNKTKKEQILEFLEREKRAPSSKIASYVGLPITYAEKYLNELVEEKLVIKEAETKSTYWKYEKA